METPGGRRVAQAALAADPAEFDATLEREVLSLRTRRPASPPTRAFSPPGTPGGLEVLGIAAMQSLGIGDMLMQDEDGDMMDSLQRRVDEVRHNDRSRTASELLHAKVLRRFRDRKIPLVPPLAQSGAGLGEVEPRRLVAGGLYSEDSLDMVRSHVMSIIGKWEHLSRDFPLQLSMFQTGQVYAASAVFGYALRRADARYRLERSFGDAGGADSLAEFVGGFDAQHAAEVATIASWEAEEVLDRHTSAIFGDMAALQAEVVQALDRAQQEPRGAGEGARSNLQRLIAERKVASVRLSVGELRRLALEGCALGRLLGEAEAELESELELTSASGHGPTTLVSGNVESGLSFSDSKMFGA